MKHTPAPWVNDHGVVTGMESRERFQNGSSPSLDIFDIGEWPCELLGEALANAALIAAAPDLLMACKSIKRFLEASSDISVPQYLSDAILKAEIIIRG